MPSKALQTITKVLNAPEDQRQNLMDRTDAQLAQWYSTPSGRLELEELAYVLMGFAWADAMKQDIVPLIIESKTVGLDEIDYMEEDLRGLQAYWQGTGGEIVAGIIRNQRERMPREEMAIAIDLHDDQIRTSFWGTLSDLRSHAADKMRLLPMEKLIQLVARALPAGTTIDGDPLTAVVPLGTLADSDVDPIQRAVLRYSKAGVSFVGTQHALFNLADIGLVYGDNVSAELFRTGIIGQYKGSNVVVVENSTDFFGDDIMPENEIWIVGQNAGRLTYYGNQVKTQVLARSGFNKQWESARDAGMSLFGAEAGRIGRIVLS